VSVPSNSAEGSARRTTREFVAFLHVARGSLAEVETQLMLARRVGYLEAKMILESEELINEVGRLLNAVLAACVGVWKNALHYPPSPNPYPLPSSRPMIRS
jgi:four helix bundle protein